MTIPYSDEVFADFVDKYGKLLTDVEHYPKKAEYYFKLWKYRNEQEIRSNAVVPGEPSECPTGSE